MATKHRFERDPGLTSRMLVTMFLLFLLYAVISSWRHGELAPTNPWGSKTLEWTVPNPIPLENFEVLPVVTSDAYGYGEEPFEPLEEPSEPDRLEPAHAGIAADEESTEGAPA